MCLLKYNMNHLLETINSIRETCIQTYYNAAVTELNNKIKDDPFGTEFIIDSGCVSRIIAQEIAYRFNQGNTKTTVHGGTLIHSLSLHVKLPLPKIALTQSLSPVESPLGSLPNSLIHTPIKEDSVSELSTNQLDEKFIHDPIDSSSEMIEMKNIAASTEHDCEQEHEQEHEDDDEQRHGHEDEQECEQEEWHQEEQEWPQEPDYDDQPTEQIIWGDKEITLEQGENMEKWIQESDQEVSMEPVPDAFPKSIWNPPSDQLIIKEFNPFSQEPEMQG